MASIMLTASDNVGVAHTYYILDGGAQAEGLSVMTSVLGSHTLSFWSVDAAGNVEAATLVTFEVTAAPAGTPRCTIDSTKWSNRHRTARLKGTIAPAKVGDHAVLYVKKPGSSKWVRVATLTAKSLNGKGGATWSYTYKASKRGTYRFQVRYSGMISGVPMRAPDRD
jgi:hypothetical protein